MYELYHPDFVFQTDVIYVVTALDPSGLTTDVIIFFISHQYHIIVENSH